MVWTDHRVEQLKKLWNDGKSASQIADDLGDVSRNAVIGKAHRLGLSSRPSPIKRKTFVLPTVGERVCQWPIGDPGEPEFHFCEQAALPSRPYCEDHCTMAYRRKSEAA
jgi:GcrA cell cycle regulator